MVGVSFVMSSVADDATVDALLSFLRQYLGDRSLDYADAPRPLTGGLSSAEVFGFSLRSAPAAWAGPLVVRFLPTHGDPHQAQLEHAVQNGVASQGFPAPRVLVGEHTGDVLGRRFLVMERVPGSPLFAGMTRTQMLWRGPRLWARLPEVLAQVALDLHALDAAPVLNELERQGLVATALGPDRWLRRTEAAISRWALDGLAPGLEWTRQHAPVPPAKPSVCHGVLGPGNFFGTDTTVTGVIDWTLAGLAHPAYELGFATATIELAPVPVPRPARRPLGVATRRLAQRFQGRYAQRRSIDHVLIDYYRALHCLDELTEVAGYRAAGACGQGAHYRVRPTWDLIADKAVAYFRDLTGVTLQIPTAL